MKSPLKPIFITLVLVGLVVGFSLGLKNHPSLTVSPTVYVTPTSTQTPAPVPTATPRIIPTLTPTPEVNAKAESILLDVINTYRQSKGKSLVSADVNTCALAEKRLGEIVTDFSHNQFLDHSSITIGGYWYENLARYANDTNVVGAWIASPTHNANLLADVKYMCIRASNGYYALEAWRPL